MPQFIQYQWLVKHRVDEEAILYPRNVGSFVRTDAWSVIGCHIPDDFRGEELLAWALVSKAATLASPIRMQTWEACYIQAARQRYKRRKLIQGLALKESLSESSSVFITRDEKTDEETTKEHQTSAQKSNSSQVMQNLGVTTLAKRFAINTRKGVRKNKSVELPLPILAKPEEPNDY
ncbi:LOW QUALITY PROTEIN: hypothetical protein Cgig2_033864 [Carnegiea gigantea]|uniref:Uncharacterized protein n=1 Tax=Carnegiea gigantea TaxID=171969 RepID=A0A9Q1JXF9_9CARY|nr:LOW QUALITY PROTEIN: hypothetical protein Cgig2_033864 [Carnegiea gigantea]